MTKRKKFSPQSKIDILQQYLQKKHAMTDICQTHECSPGSVYQWQETLFSKGHQLFENKTGRPINQQKRDIEAKALEEKLATKNAIIAELMEELLKEKKLNGVI